ncbi:hypothetical protein J4423_04330 [Candidatus Pacearchaeota archaeon]|nr:hypothetical protein [Candidatus Pacearchaeota archaeon]
MNSDIFKKIKGQLGKLPKNWIVMLETLTKNSLDLGLESVKILTDQGLDALIVSASRPCNKLLELYEEKKIDTKKVFIICTVCKSQGIDVKDTKSIRHVRSYDSLMEILISLEKIKSELKKEEGFLFIDSISSLLIHNDSRKLSQFIHRILVTIRINNINGILISLNEEINKEVRAEIAQLCDKVISV